MCVCIVYAKILSYKSNITSKMCVLGQRCLRCFKYDREYCLFEYCLFLYFLKYADALHAKRLYILIFLRNGNKQTDTNNNNTCKTTKKKGLKGCGYVYVFAIGQRSGECVCVYRVDEMEK